MTPDDIFGDFGVAALGVLPWVVYMVGAVVGVALVLIGIKKGLWFFFDIIRGDESHRAAKASMGGMSDAYFDAFTATADRMLKDRDAGFYDESMTDERIAKAAAAAGRGADRAAGGAR